MEKSNLDKARIYHQAVSRHDSDLVQSMVHEDYLQHNPRVPTGRAAFLSLFPELRRHGTIIENLRIFQDGDHVIMHHRWRNAFPFGSAEKIAFHIIRFDNSGLIAEHWSVMNEPFGLNRSGRSEVDGECECEIETSFETENNKKMIKDLFQEALVGKVTLPRYFHPVYHQHHHDLSDGANHFAELKLSLKTLHTVFGSGNFVLSISEGSHKGAPMAFYDLFRMKDQLIVEHWSIYQEIPQINLANENTMFNFDLA